ncbi:MAG: DNA-processing protein DprA [Clostridiales Family XIII bacterium]|jgi:DNA processing protein|nr:DNA-processing protein DprA [Clostridiales Family XIII bacterium]
MARQGTERPYIDRKDSRYPVMLSLIANPPERLYFIGSPETLKYPKVAVVGSRKSTDYGRWAAYTIAKRLSGHGVCVVSGMAEGIDAWAHKGALAGGTPTIAVFGTGLDICFPQSNRGLMHEIEKTGLILSEYADGTRGARFTFPARNRIISGLSCATVVAEAGFSSGSLITAERAAEQGREVYAVPGNINRWGSVGCNKLIADGARPIVFIDDILADLGIETDIAGSLDASLPAEESRVMAAVRRHGEISIDRLAAEAGFSVGTLTSIVTLLEIKGCLSTGAGKVFVPAAAPARKG